MSDSLTPKGGDAQAQHPSVADDRPHTSEGAPSSLPTPSPSPAADRRPDSASSFFHPGRKMGIRRRYLEHRYSRIRSQGELSSTTPKRIVKIKPARRFSVIPSRSSAEVQGPEEEGVSSMADVDSGLHKEELPDWMSHLFQKLDMEVNEDSICSTGKVTQVETQTHPLAEGDISSEIHLSTKLKDSSMCQKMDSEANDDIYCSYGNVTHVETNQLVDGGFSSEIHGPSEAKDSTMDKVDASGMDDDSALLGWIVGLLKKGGHDDLLSQFDLDQVETNSMCYDVPDEVVDLDEDAEDSRKSMKRVSHKETLEKGIKWMSEECFLAFTKSEERNRFEGIEHKFGELRSQCLSIEAYDKIFHHYNFTIEAKHGGSDVWSSGLYFAEVKQLFGLKSYFCCLLEPLDDGLCYGCQNQNVGDLQHPSKGGYEEGHADICWPFVDQTDSDSDDDCGLGYIT